MTPGAVAGRRLRSTLATLLLVATALAGGAPALAQTPEHEPVQILLPADLEPDQRDAFIEALAALERPVVLGEKIAPAPPSLSDEVGFTVIIARFDDALLGIADVPEAVNAWWRGLAPANGTAPLLAVIFLAVALAGGALVEWGADRLLGRWRRRAQAVQTERFAPRFGAVMGSFALDLVAIVTFAAGTLVVGWLLLPDTPGARLTLAVVIIAAFKLRLLLALGHLLFAPHRRHLRLIPMPDDDAQRLWRGILVAVVVPVIAGVVRDLLAGSGATAAGGAFLGLVVAAIQLGAQLYLLLVAAEPIRRLLLTVTGDAPGATAAALRRFAEIWHLVFIALAVVAFAISVYVTLALESGAIVSASFGPLLPLFLLPFALGAYGALITDLVIRDADGTRRAVLGEVARTLGQGVILLVTLAVVARRFGMDPFLGARGDFADRVAGALFEASAAVLIGWALWHALRVFLEHEAPAEGEEPSEDGMGKPGSRIATLMPVLRSFLFLTIAAISGMTALAALGVEIGPLLAGAGVIGLAVGFGAQTLVQDVITGLFYLIEDAFRTGEYIETDAGKGVVEKISARSVRLRHHRGPLYTIPFGKMGNIVNHSRDWVKIKFDLRVTFDTDLERVRKVIKRVGQAMLEDPALGPLFLQPVKSQGVTAVDDYGFVISVKFLCRPGEQFLIRREAYARIKQAFVQNGIEFASPRVTVDTEAASGGHPPAAAAAAAASRALPGAQSQS